VSLKKTVPGLTLPQVHLLVCSVIPRRTCNAQWVREIVAYWQRRNYIASRSHRKRRIVRLTQLK
jgi:hypothetical protein